MATFAERLRELREKASMTQVQLADASGASLSSIRNCEQGIRDPYWRVIFRLAAALGTTCEQFADCAGISQGASAAPARRRKRK